MAVVENIIYKIETEGADKFKKDLQDAAKSQQDLTKAVDSNTEALKDYNKAMDSRKNQLSQLDKESQAFKDLEAEIKAAELSVNNLNKSQDSLKKQFAETKKQIEGVNYTLGELDKAGLKNTQTYQNLKVKLGELEAQGGQLKDSISDMNTKLKNLGSDTAGIDATIQGFQGMIAVTEIAMGAQALFGANSKQLEETLVKLNGVMALANGVQQIQNILQKESALSTYALGVAQSAYTAIVEASTIATAAFRAALMALGIGAIIAGIYALYEGYKKLTDGTYGASSSTTDYVEKSKNALEASKNRAEALKKEEEYLRALGKTELEIANGQANAQKKVFEASKQNRDALRKQLAEQQAELATYESGPKKLLLLSKFFVQKSIESTKELLANANGEVVKAGQQYVILKAKTNSEVKKLNEESVKDEKKTSNEKIKIKKDEKDANEKLIDELWKQQEQLIKATIAEEKRLAKDEEDRQLKFKKNIEIKGKSITDLNELEIKSEKVKFDAKKILDEQEIERRKNDAETIKGLINLISEAQQGTFSLIQQGIQNNLQSELESIDEKKEKELSATNLTEKEKESINKKYRAQEAAVKLKAWKAEQELKKSQAIMNGALAATNIFANGTPIAWPFLLGLVLLQTAAQVAVIDNQKPPKFAKGGSVAKRLGYIEGKPHSAGGEVIEVEGNEFVFRKEAVKHYGVSMLEQMNNLQLSMPKETGQSVIINYDKLGDVIGEKLRQNPMLRVSIDKKGVNTAIGKTEIMNNYIDF